MNKTIRNLTLSDIGDGSGTELDLIAFQAAADNYLDAHDDDDCTAEDAIAALFGNGGDMWVNVHEWAPAEAALADAATQTYPR